MNKLDRDYQALLQDVLENGVVKQDRTSTGTISLFGRQIRHKMEDGFPLLTTKKVFWKGVVAELIWFLRGDTNIKWLVENGVHIWTGDCFKEYSKHFVPHDDAPDINDFTHEILYNDVFARKWGDLGPTYGQQWRNWGSRYEANHILHTKKQIKPGIDQIANLINDLKTNPDSRRLMVNAWNVGELDNMTLPPCHYGFQVYTRPTTREEKIVNPGKYRAISLMFNMRSSDLFLGAPFNIASYGLLLEIIAKAVNMVPDELIGNLGDVHLYSNHVEQAREQINREPYALPQLVINSGNENWPLLEIDEIIQTLDPDITFGLSNYQSHPAIKAPLSN
jgi:thymidylate synthase